MDVRIVRTFAEVCRDGVLAVFKLFCFPNLIMLFRKTARNEECKLSNQYLLTD
jgi:hypothetical protein